MRRPSRLIEPREVVWSSDLQQLFGQKHRAREWDWRWRLKGRGWRVLPDWSLNLWDLTLPSSSVWIGFNSRPLLVPENRLVCCGKRPFPRPCPKHTRRNGSRNPEQFWSTDLKLKNWQKRSVVADVRTALPRETSRDWKGAEGWFWGAQNLFLGAGARYMCVFTWKLLKLHIYVLCICLYVIDLYKKST